MSNGPFYQGGCGCGAVTLIATGAPLAAVNCDCDLCRGERRLLWSEAAVQLAGGLEALDGRRASHGGWQRVCRHCGESVLTEHAEAGIVEMPASALPEVEGAEGDGEALLARLGHR
ncbi:GFA family protein [Halomonas nitroreducens]|uniref:CENP-V/GFA domain-containing protein n=1 Tax=Halomonas nitroreducens TaxID=447425 RepID=A0A431V4Q5_9GAMM|nr:hypothetical protein [Halomonas nitroreducens]RTR05257.1 hypothetical protein EKG36_06635 [Halomonas nitroreducens]